MLELHAVLWQLYAFLGTTSWVRLSELNHVFKRLVRHVALPVPIQLSNRFCVLDAKEIQKQWPNLHFVAHVGPTFHDVVVDTQRFVSLHTLHITRCHQLEFIGPLPKLHHLTLDNCAGVRSVIGLDMLETLTIVHCPNLLELPPIAKCQRVCVRHCPQLNNFTSWVQLHELVLEGNNAHNNAVHVPSQLHRLELTHLSYFTHEIVSIPHIHLSGCYPCQLPHEVDWVTCAIIGTRLTNVDALSHALCVDLSGSWCLEDIAPLAHVKTLNLTDCTALVNVDALAQVHELNLTNCYRIQNVNKLQFVHALNLTGCWNVRDISQLSNVVELNLTGVGQLTSLDGLSKLKRLTLGSNRLLELQSPLGHLEMISITDCISIVSIEALQGIPYVYIDGCRQLVDISPLAAAKEVTISNCPFVNDVTPLCNVPKICLHHLSQINDVAMLGSAGFVQYLELERIPFQSAKGIHTIRQLRIKDCWGFTDCEYLRSTALVRGCGCQNHTFFVGSTQ